MWVIPSDFSRSCLEAVSYEPKYKKPLMMVAGIQLS
jgi:hypothetical protein